MEYRLAHADSWTHLSLFRRLLVTTFMAATCASVIAFLVALADGPWVLLGMLSFAIFYLFMLPGQLFPERAAEWSVRWTFPTAEAMERGDRNRSWPG